MRVAGAAERARASIQQTFNVPHTVHAVHLVQADLGMSAMAAAKRSTLEHKTSGAAAPAFASASATTAGTADTAIAVDAAATTAATAKRSVLAQQSSSSNAADAVAAGASATRVAGARSQAANRRLLLSSFSLNTKGLVPPEMPLAAK